MILGRRRRIATLNQQNDGIFHAAHKRKIQKLAESWHRSKDRYQVIQPPWPNFSSDRWRSQKKKRFQGSLFSIPKRSPAELPGKVGLDPLGNVFQKFPPKKNLTDAEEPTSSAGLDELIDTLRIHLPLLWKHQTLRSTWRAPKNKGPQKIVVQSWHPKADIPWGFLG